MDSVITEPKQSYIIYVCSRANGNKKHRVDHGLSQKVKTEKLYLEINNTQIPMKTYINIFTKYK